MLLKQSLLLLTLSFAYLSGGVVDYLKLPEDKTGPHQMRNIDFIYMINLDERPEKYAHSMNELAPYGIIPYRYSAINGWKLPQGTFEEIGVKYKHWMRQNLMATCFLPDKNGLPTHEVMNVPHRTYFAYDMSKGAIGCVLSHLSILKDAYDSGYETIWVMEDDIEVIKNPHLISDLIDKLNETVGHEGWDFLFTDLDTKGQNGEYVPCFANALRPNFVPSHSQKFWERVDVSPEFRKVGARYGAYSMIVRRSAMKKILDLTMSGIFLPIDMEYTLPENIRLFTVREDIVSTQPQAKSDNKLPGYMGSLNNITPNP